MDQPLGPHRITRRQRGSAGWWKCKSAWMRIHRARDALLYRFKCKPSTLPSGYVPSLLVWKAPASSTMDGARTDQGVGPRCRQAGDAGRITGPQQEYAFFVDYLPANRSIEFKD